MGGAAKSQNPLFSYCSDDPDSGRRLFLRAGVAVSARAPCIFPPAAAHPLVCAASSTMPPSIISSSISTQKDMDALPIINYRLINLDTGYYRRQVCKSRGTPEPLSSRNSTDGTFRVLLGYGERDTRSLYATEPYTTCVAQFTSRLRS